jgi:hypothetical protein
MNGRWSKPLFVSTASVLGNISNLDSQVQETSSSLIESDDDDDSLEEIDEEDLEVVEDFADEDDEESDIHQMNDDEIAKLPRGIPNDYAVVQQWTIPPDGLDLSPANDDIDRQLVIQRLQLTSTNVSLPVALMLLFPDQYHTLSRARKICRKGNFLLHRGPWLPTEDGSFVLDREKCKVGRVGDRVCPGGKCHEHGLVG